MPKHNTAAQEACCAGVAPTACAACMTIRMLEANPTTTAVAADETKLNHPALFTAAEPPADILKPA